MATHFDFLAQARPASLYKLLERLSMGDAAIVLTGVPHNLAIQTLAFFPDDQQGPMLPAMRDARHVSDQLREQTAQKIRSMLEAAKNARGGSVATARPEPAPAPARPASVSASAASKQPSAQPGPVDRAPAAPAAVRAAPSGERQQSEAGNASFFAMDPSASVLTGSAPADEFGDAPPVKPRIPLTPRFSPPGTMMKKRAAEVHPEAHPGGGGPAGADLPISAGDVPLVHEAMANQLPSAHQPPPGPARPPMARQAGPGSAPQPPAPPSGAPAGARSRPEPAGPAARPGSDAAMNFKQGANPYDSAPPAHELAAKDERTPNSGEMLGQAIADIGQKIKRAFTPGTGKKNAGSKADAPGGGSGDGFKTRDPAASRSTAPSARKKAPPPSQGAGKPVPWTPRAATTSPINGPALPNSPPPVSGDPFSSPLAKAGLLDLIGRAQEKYLPKDTVKGTRAGQNVRRAVSERRAADEAALAPRKRPPQKPGRPEPMEGVMALDKVGFNKTPRVIGPRPKAEELVGDDRVPASGAKRMDGKAILAAILRSAGPDIRNVVAQDDPKLFKELRGRMFYFDDLIYTEKDSLARVFTAAPAESAALALKFAAPALKKRVLAAVSPGRAKALTDPPPRAGLDDIEAAQKQVLNVALKLQAAGRILIDPRDPDLAGA